MNKYSGEMSKASIYGLSGRKEHMPHWMRVMYSVRKEIPFNIREVHKINKIVGPLAGGDTILKNIIKYGKTPNYIKKVFDFYEKAENIKNQYDSNSIYGYIYFKIISLFPFSSREDVKRTRY